MSRPPPKRNSSSGTLGAEFHDCHLWTSGAAGVQGATSKTVLYLQGRSVYGLCFRYPSKSKSAMFPVDHKYPARQMKIMRLFFCLCFVLSGAADGPVRDLSDVRKVCVAQFDGEGAAMGREQVIARLSNESRFQLTENSEDCDARIVGRVQVTRGQSHRRLWNAGK